VQKKNVTIRLTLLKAEGKERHGKDRIIHVTHAWGGKKKKEIGAVRNLKMGLHGQGELKAAKQCRGHHKLPILRKNQ